jgi:hypothetical protein
MSILRLVFRCALGLWLRIQGGQVLKEEAMHEDVATPDFAQEDAFSGLIEKGHQVPWEAPCTPEKDSQGEVLEEALQPHFLS